MENEQENAETGSASANDQLVTEEFTEKEAFKRLLGDATKWKSEARQVKEQLAALEQERRNAEVEQLKQQEKYKELYERAQQEAETYKTKVNEVQGVYLTDLKFQALEREAAKSGLRPEAYDDLRLFNTDGVIVETTSQGNANVLGAREFVDQLKSSKPYLFEDRTPPKVNGNVPSGVADDRVLSPKEFLKFEKSDPEKYQREYMRYLKHNNK